MTTGLNIERFEKRPVQITAAEFTGTLENHAGMCGFLGQAGEHEHFDDDGVSFDPAGNLADDGQQPDLDKGGSVEIITLEGRMTVSVGDWVIKGVKGEFYPCKPDIFEETYRWVGTVEDPDQLALFDCD